MMNSEIVFTPGENRSAAAEHLTDLILVVGELLVRLRHVTGQATLPGPESLLAAGGVEIADLPQLASDSLPGPLGQPRFQKYLLATAITAEGIRFANALGPSFNPPTHEVLFLDAIGAYREKDYRRAILYVTIATEVAFGSVIEGAYERMLAGQDDEKFRVISLRQAGGETIRKDPIYEKLRQRSDFNVFLHELSLYVLRRSLLAENQTLYADAKRLYSTRNQLVHSGELAESDSSPPYPLDVRGAMAALRTAVALFSWLGIRDDFPLPDVEFVSSLSEADR
jgi:hypothetical protein